MGKPEDNERARALLEAKVGGRAFKESEDGYAMVNIRGVGHLLGKNGQELKRMAETSQAQIKARLVCMTRDHAHGY
jgi:hypothetical protein